MQFDVRHQYFFRVQEKSSDAPFPEAGQKFDTYWQYYIPGCTLENRKLELPTQ